MEETIIPIVIVGMLFIGLPWIIFHYITQWKANASLTAEDENLLDELYELSRRLDERMTTIERIMRADNPTWNPLPVERPTPRLEKVEELRPRRAVDRIEAGRSREERA